MTVAQLKQIEDCVWETLKNHTTPQVVSHAMVKIKSVIDFDDIETPVSNEAIFEILTEVVDAVCQEGVITPSSAQALMIPDMFEQNAAIIELRSNLLKVVRGME